MPQCFNPRRPSLPLLARVTSRLVLLTPLRGPVPLMVAALVPALFASGPVLSATADTSSAVVIAVEASGSDSANGDASTGPVRTIQRAQALARAKIAAMVGGSAPRSPVRVLIGPGDYPISGTLIFTPADSGTSAAPVSYEARQPGTVQISGGINLGSKTAASAGVTVSYAAPPDAAAVSGGSQLYVNGRRATLARQPNADEAWFVQGALSLPGEPAGKQGMEAFIASPGNLSWIESLSAADRKRAIVDVYHSWTTSKHRLSAEPTRSGSVRVTPRALWPFLGQGGTSQRYFIENVSSALDAPGEWIYDSSAVRYISRSDEAGKPLQATVPVLEKLVLIKGEPGKPVVGLQFVGLAFAHSRYVMPESGMVDYQAATEVTAAVEVNRATGFVFRDCSVQHTGGWGLWLREAVRDATVTGSTFADLGAGGIKVGLGAQSATDGNATGANQIVGNIVSETGKIFPGAVGIWVGQSWDNQVLRNTIHDTTYTGISVGWSWGYAPATSGRNLIKGNLLYNIGLRQQGDMGGIYTLGRSPGTIIANNIIRNVRGYPSYGVGAWGIYNDNGSSGILLEGNVVLDTDSGGYHLSLGKDNTLKGNVFAGGDAPEINIVNPGSEPNVVLQGNLIAPKGLQPFNQFSPDPGIKFDGNEVSSYSGQAQALEKCRGGCVQGNSKLQAGAVPTDIRTTNAAWMGVINTAVAIWRGDGSGTARAANVENATGDAARPKASLFDARSLVAVAESPKALVAPAADLLVDFAGAAPGSRPVNLVYFPSDNLSVLKMEAQADAPNGKCLAFNDGPSLANQWEPYAFAQLNHTQGSTVVDFELKIDAAANMSVEWRDDAKPFLTGPAMIISAAGVQVAGKVVAPMSAGVWTKFRMIADLGPNSGKWSLEVMPAEGRKTSVTGLAIKTSGWQRFNTLGFSAAGTAVSHACIASIKAVNKVDKAAASR